MITKDRVVNVLGVAGAIFCLVMILAGPGQAEEDDDKGAPAPPATSQVAPPPGVAPAPGVAPPAAPGQSQPAAPPAQQPADDDDGDDDDG